MENREVREKEERMDKGEKEAVTVPLWIWKSRTQRNLIMTLKGIREKEEEGGSAKKEA